MRRTWVFYSSCFSPSAHLFPSLLPAMWSSTETRTLWCLSSLGSWLSQKGLRTYLIRVVRCSIGSRVGDVWHSMGETTVYLPWSPGGKFLIACIRLPSKGLPRGNWVSLLLNSLWPKMSFELLDLLRLWAIFFFLRVFALSCFSSGLSPYLVFP